jgi:hypothetical protein
MDGCGVLLQMKLTPKSPAKATIRATAIILLLCGLLGASIMPPVKDQAGVLANE